MMGDGSFKSIVQMVANKRITPIDSNTQNDVR